MCFLPVDLTGEVLDSMSCVYMVGVWGLALTHNQNQLCLHTLQTCHTRISLFYHLKTLAYSCLMRCKIPEHIDPKLARCYFLLPQLPIWIPHRWPWACPGFSTILSNQEALWVQTIREVHQRWRTQQAWLGTNAVGLLQTLGSLNLTRRLGLFQTWKCGIKMGTQQYRMPALNLPVSKHFFSILVPCQTRWKEVWLSSW